jgi:hypothetical protein
MPQAVHYAVTWQVPRLVVQRPTSKDNGSSDAAVAFFIIGNPIRLIVENGSDIAAVLPMVLAAYAVTSFGFLLSPLALTASFTPGWTICPS